MAPRKSTAAKSTESTTPEPDSAKRLVLEKAVGDILKRYGEGSIMKLGEAQNMLTTDSISTGSLSLDIALGVGGVPREYFNLAAEGLLGFPPSFPGGDAGEDRRLAELLPREQRVLGCHRGKGKAGDNKNYLFFQR